MSTALRTAQEVAEQFQISAWTIEELVRQRKVECVRIGTTDVRPGLVRFTDEQVAQIIASLTVEAETAEAPRRRKRRAS